MSVYWWESGWLFRNRKGYLTGKMYQKLVIYQPSKDICWDSDSQGETQTEMVSFVISHQWLQLWRSLLFTFSSIHHWVHCFWKEVELRISVWELNICSIEISCPYSIIVLIFIRIVFKSCSLLTTIMSYCCTDIPSINWNVESNLIFKREVTHLLKIKNYSQQWFTVKRVSLLLLLFDWQLQLLG